MRFRTIFLFLSGFFVLSVFPKSTVPSHLMTDLLEHTERVFMDGYPTSFTLSDMPFMVESYQVAEIHRAHPSLSWQLECDKPATLQKAYRILVATNQDLLAEGKADVWDSGPVESDLSIAVPMEGMALQPSTTYYWTVKVWDNHGAESSYSSPKAFRTAASLDDTFPRYPLQKDNDSPVCIRRLSDTSQVVDFGRDAFGQLAISLHSSTGRDTVTVHLGEAILDDGHVNRHPGGTIRYTKYLLPLMSGTHTYHLKIRPDGRNTDMKANESSVKPILMPDYVGEVYPFRYCELENYRPDVTEKDVIRSSVHYWFDDEASSFISSDTVLNKVWDLCKYTIRATSFAGVYVDGDRERIPYEADALINQLGHYGVDHEYSMARYSVDYLIAYPTWPTEWILQSVLMVWYEYLNTGDIQLIQRHYDLLKARTMLALTQTNGLISTKKGQTSDFLSSIGYRGKSMRDIVDWPQSGAFGIGKKEAGEADGYQLTDHITVVNAYHYEALHLVAEMARILGKSADERFYAQEAVRVADRINKLLLNPQTGCYMDGLESDHSSLHANMFPLAFGFVPDRYRGSVLDFIHSRGMACSVYGAQFLLDALYEAEDADYALSLMNATHERSWYNMIRVGSTIAMEAWDTRFKNNLDWNHAWGAAPANIIPRKLMGVEPLEPGFRTFRIKPQPGSLRSAEAVVPTIRGSVKVAFQNMPGKFFSLDVEIPANSEAQVYLPFINRKGRMQVDGDIVKGTMDGKFVRVTLGSGHHHLQTSL